MDDKTAELRDIFLDVTDDEAVTETQEEGRGSLVGDDADVDERIAAVIARMRDRFEFDTSLDDDALHVVVTGFYDGETDTAIADAVGCSRDAVRTARLDLHLLRDRDTDAPFDLDDLRERLERGGPGGDPGGDPDVAAIAADLDVSPSTVRSYRRVLETQRRIRRVNGRFTDEFEELLTDAALEGDLTEDVTHDGLEEATEGMETDVSF